MKTSPRFLFRLAAGPALAVASLWLLASCAALRGAGAPEPLSDATREYCLASGRLALDGYDPVAYFDPGAPTPGSPDLEFVLEGVRYRFSTIDNRARFQAAPSIYKPAYGGWSAAAMAAGRKAKPDPRRFRISGDRLFLFHEGMLDDPEAEWIADEERLAAKADAEWGFLSGEPGPSASGVRLRPEP